MSVRVCVWRLGWGKGQEERDRADTMPEARRLGRVRGRSTELRGLLLFSHLKHVLHTPLFSALVCFLLL